jgi:hypothetical protein
VPDARVWKWGRRSQSPLGGHGLKPQQKGLHRTQNVFEEDRAKFVEREVEPAVHMVADGARNTYPARWTLGLEPGRDIHALAMQVRTIGNYVTDVDANAKPDGLIGGMIAIVTGHLLLHFDRAAHCPVDAIEHDEQRIASGLNDPPTMLVDRWID